MYNRCARGKIASAIFVIALGLNSATAESNKTFRLTTSRDGKVSVDGKAVSRNQIDATFRDISAKHGHVQYYRESPDETADAITSDILRAGEKYNVVIGLATEPDFSDVQPGAKQNAKAVVLAAPKPEYPESLRKNHITGAGVFVLHIDPYTGSVLSVQTERSTGVALLDKSARTAFERWQFKPNTTKTNRVKIPIAYTLSGSQTQL